ncbi:unnamed protein product [Rotaria sordida]|uniref:BED-type domain-containing protein n=1 Tax=Rotaria sordida TaxID=392033 RepID=A0A815GIG6_9BILA|nr:unnamed protein product [Rotaria sordida]CAF1595815.1 unnamed protein product [Rotaria sordida]
MAQSDDHTDNVRIIYQLVVHHSTLNKTFCYLYLFNRQQQVRIHLWIIYQLVVHHSTLNKTFCYLYLFNRQQQDNLSTCCSSNIYYLVVQRQTINKSLRHLQLFAYQEQVRVSYGIIILGRITRSLLICVLLSVSENESKVNNEGGVTENSQSTQTMSSAKQSRVWAYFERIYGDQGLQAKCLVGDCAKVLSTPLHSTSTLIRHLRDVHEVDEFKPKEKLVHRSKQKGIPVKLKKKLDRALATTNETNPHDSELRLSDSLQKINIIDDEQSMNQVRAVENDVECTDTDDENEDSDEEDNNNINQDDDGGNFSDEGDSISINSESDIESSDDSLQNNFEVGVDVHPSESSDLSLPQPDPLICLVVEKSRLLIDIIKDSSILSSFIKKKKYEYNQYNDNKIKSSLFLDVRTRWNSTFKMLHTLNVHRPIIIELFQNKTNLDITKKQQQRLNALELTSDCWYIIELLIKILKPFYRATKAISGSDYPTIGITLFIFRRLEKDFLSNISPTDDPLFNNMKECLLSKMIYYNMVKDPSQTKTIMFYGYFDPYGISVMTNNEINKIENEIKYIIRQQTSNSSTQASSTTSSNTNGSLTTEKEKKKSLLNYFLDSLADEDTQQVKKQSSTLNKILNDEFKTYKKLAGHFVSTSSDLYDSLQFWKKNKLLLPNLALLAQKYLASPSTSTKSESAFSISAYYGRKQRARLSPENLGFSVFLKDKLSNENK